jgi:hypothetical protein
MRGGRKPRTMLLPKEESSAEDLLAPSSGEPLEMAIAVNLAPQRASVTPCRPL